MLIQSRPFTAHQAVQVVQSVEDDFVRFETAVAIYDRLLNKNSFQLVLNEFDNKADRENLCLRLHIKFQETGISTDYPDGLNRGKATPSVSTVTAAQESYSVVKCEARSEYVKVKKADIDKPAEVVSASAHRVN